MTFWQNLRILAKLAPFRLRVLFVALVFLLVLSGVAELISIGATIPFITSIIFPDKIAEVVSNFPFLKGFEFGASDQSRFLIASVMLLAITCAVLLRSVTIFIQYRLIHQFGITLSSEILRRVLFSDYSNFSRRAGGEIFASVLTKSRAVSTSVIQPLLIIFCSLVILIFIFLSMLLVSAIAAMSIILVFSLLYLLISVMFNKSMVRKSRITNTKSTEVIRAITEILAEIKLVQVYQTQNKNINEFKKSETALRMTEASVQILANLPRIFIEGTTIIIFVLAAYFLTLYVSQPEHYLPIVAAMGLGAQRSLPLVQHIFSSFTFIRTTTAALNEVVTFLELETPLERNSSSVTFNKSVRFENVVFSFENGTSAFSKKLNFELSKNEKVLFFGPSGTGKTTTIDLLMGVLKPTGGVIYIDNQPLNDPIIGGWQLNISYLAQNTTLLEKSVIENISRYSKEDIINLGRIRSSAEQARILDHIEEMEDKFHTILNTQGSNLSGGQQQRLSLARIFFEDRPFVICDEPTSALDKENALSIIQTLCRDENRTVVCISHDPDFKRFFDRVIHFK